MKLSNEAKRELTIRFILIIIIYIVIAVAGCSRSNQFDIRGEWKIIVTLSNPYTGSMNLITTITIYGEKDQGHFTDGIFDGTYTIMNDFVILCVYGSSGLRLRANLEDNNYIKGSAISGEINKGIFEMWRVK